MDEITTAVDNIYTGCGNRTFLYMLLTISVLGFVCLLVCCICVSWVAMRSFGSALGSVAPDKTSSFSSKVEMKIDEHTPNSLVGKGDRKLQIHRVKPNEIDHSMVGIEGKGIVIKQGGYYEIKYANKNVTKNSLNKTDEVQLIVLVNSSNIEGTTIHENFIFTNLTPQNPVTPRYLFAGDVIEFATGFDIKASLPGTISFDLCIDIRKISNPPINKP